MFTMENILLQSCGKLLPRPTQEDMEGNVQLISEQHFPNARYSRK
jgi:hypothetical protein